MRKPSRIRAALLAAPLAALAGFIVSLAAMFVLGLMAQAVFRSTDILGDVIYAEGWGVVSALLLLGAGLWIGGFAAIMLLIDWFPFGRYRLRLVPKDDPTPEVFS